MLPNICNLYFRYHCFESFCGRLRDEHLSGVAFFKCLFTISITGEGRWPRGRADVSEPGGPGFDSSSRQPQVVAHQH